MNLLEYDVTNYTFESFPVDPLKTKAVRAIHAWATTPKPDRLGLMIIGDPGTGKTGLMAAALRVCALRRDGGMGNWLTENGKISAEKLAYYRTVRAKQMAGTYRTYPRAVCLDSWPQLARRLRFATRNGRDGDVDNPTEFALLEEMEHEVHVLGLDDVTLDVASDWKVGMLLGILGRPQRGRRLILTSTVPPTEEALARHLGPTLANRVLDTTVWEHILLRGTSLRSIPDSPR